MFDLSSSWVWDYWFADDGETYHLFFLYASRALHDPDARHYRASVGHAVSDDLLTWTPVADAIVRGEAGSFDDLQRIVPDFREQARLAGLEVAGA